MALYEDNKLSPLDSIEDMEWILKLNLWGNRELNADF